MIRKSKEIRIGTVMIGGTNPIAIQSMTNTDTRDVESTTRQIHKLQDAGCEIIRVAIPDQEAAQAISEIKKRVNIPLVADIHFDYRLALAALENGADKLRINPGNIGSREKVKAVALAAKERNVPIRVGVNSGSLEKDLYIAHGVTPESLMESAMRHVRMLEDIDFNDIVIAVKSSNVKLSIAAYDLLSAQTNYPLHVGITEAGTVKAGAIKSAVGIGAILSRGLGDTIRVSLTGDPVEEVICAKMILQSLELRRFGVEFVSCPTCGRTEIDLIPLAKQIEDYCSNIDANIKVAVMGCIVNGPGEAKDADIGVAGGKGAGVIFKKGKVIKTVKEYDLFTMLIKELEEMIKETPSE
ncbi:MAG: flavodoxin-dependent (E)-4-hydroxy-3-methylbut-2-enyl-diphosphate synthase [Clostridiales bacterium]|jgi:(E)-4-hydroxy-3-methylbut-2-enyl-diphosphate synthase|nr:flavodoxin-dependent (E)-4-hydroxy-3-methylbut-2-enyl-diphosphate synthase [Clostridiales bacterium]